jgi:hypothetical protein
MMRILLIASLAVMASACSMPTEVRVREVHVVQAANQTPLEAGLGQRTAWAQASGSASAIVALPSGAGAVAQVRERAYANGFGQDIALQGVAAMDANRVEITVATQAGGGRNLAPMAKPTEAGIKAEIAARFPGAAMQVVTRPRGNAYGPYGLAVGRQRSGARCIFAWQWIDNVNAAPAGGARPQGTFSMAGQAAPASIRVRLCRSDATLDQLAAHMDQMTVDLTRRSAVPEPLEGIARVSDGSGGASQSQPRRAAPEARGTGSRPLADGPSRALGGGSAQPADVGATASMVWRADGRRYLAPVQTSRAAPLSDWARIGRPPGDARQPGSADASGLAGAHSATAIPSPHAAAGPSAAPKRGRSLDPSLPSRAYLGPSAQAGHAAPAASSYEPVASPPARADQR